MMVEITTVLGVAIIVILLLYAGKILSFMVKAALVLFLVILAMALIYGWGLGDVIGMLENFVFLGL